MGTASELISTAEGIASSATGAINSFSNQAASSIALAFQYAPSWVTAPSIPKLETGSYTAPRFTAGTYLNLSADSSLTAPTPPSISDVSVSINGELPVFNEASPSFTKVEAPSALVAQAPADVGTINPVHVPNAPVLEIPDAPVFVPTVMPASLNVDLPVVALQPLDLSPLTAAAPVFDVQIPGYSSELLGPLIAKIEDDLRNGGYGINPADEDGLWARATDRDVRTLRSAEEELQRTFAAKGFRAPPGALARASSKLIFDMNERALANSRDVALKRADMFVENRKFTIEQAGKIEEMLQRNWGFVAERAVKVAELTSQFAHQALQVKIAQHNARVENAKLKLAEYETAIRAASAATDVFKTKLESARLSLEDKRVMFDLYKTQVETLRTEIEIYKTEVEAANIEANISRTVVDIYKARVEGYQALVAAKSEEYKAYESQVRAQMAEVEVYKAKVETFATRVDAYKSNMQAAEIQARTNIANQNLKLEAYKSNIASYTAKLDLFKTKISAGAEIYGLDVKAFESESSLRVESLKAQAQHAIASAQVSVSVAEANARTAVGAMGASASMVSAKGQVAVGAMNAQAQVAHAAYGMVSGIALDIASGN